MCIPPASSLALLWIAGFAIAAATGCDRGLPAAAAQARAEAAPAVPASEPPLLRAALVRAAPDVTRFREVGRVHPWRTVTLAAEVPGRVIAVRYEVGDVTAAPAGTSPTAMATAGQEAVLVEIDPEGYEISVRRAEAMVGAAAAAERLALRERDRAVDAGKGDGRALSRSDVDRAENAHELALARRAEAEAALEDARLARRRCTVRGPAGAHVSARFVEPGDYVVPGRPVLEVQEDRAVRVAFDVPGERLRSLPVGTEVAFEVKEWPGVRHEGKVVRAGPRADERSRRFPVELRVENPERLLVPGMVATLELTQRRSDAVLAVCPREAVGQRLEERFVLVLRAEGAVEKRPVRLEDRPELPPDEVAVTGVRPGEVVLLEGLSRLHGGEKARARLDGAASPLPATPAGRP